MSVPSGVSLLVELEAQVRRTLPPAPRSIVAPVGAIVTWDEIFPEFEKRDRRVTWIYAKKIFESLGYEIRKKI